MAKTYDEKIGSITEEIKQLENKKKQLIQQQKQQERDARTRRLIERGAIVESLIGDIESLTNEDIKAVLSVALNSEAAHDTLALVRKRKGAVVATEPPKGLDTEPETDEDEEEDEEE